MTAGVFGDGHDGPAVCGPVVVACRRCGRPLSDPLAVAAGLGPRCAVRAAVEAVEPPSGLGVEQAALALLTARLVDVERPVVDAILDEAPPGEVTVFLASLCAWMVAETTGGREWLRKFALKVAEGAC